MTTHQTAQWRVQIEYDDGSTRGFNFSHQAEAIDFRDRVVRRPRKVETVRLMRRPMGEWSEIETTAISQPVGAVGR